MPWLPPAVIANISSSCLLSLLYYYLYRQDRQRYLAVWAVSWGAYGLRFVFLLPSGNAFSFPGLLLCSQLASLASGVLLLYGSYLFIEKPFPRAWVLGALLGAVWLVAAVPLHLRFPVVSLPIFLFFGSVYIWTGTLFLRLREHAGLGRKILGWSFVLWGLHKLDYPFLAHLEWFAPWGYLLASLLGLTVALGVLLLYFEKTRRELELSEERFRLLAENAKDIIYRLRVKPALAFDYISPAVFSLTGYQPEEYYADPALLFRTIHPEDNARLQELLRGHGHSPNILRLLDRNNRTIWAELQNTPIADDKGDLVAIEGIIRDITSRLQAEERAKQLQRQHALLLEWVGDGIFGLDSEGRATFVNPAAARMLGWEVAELTGRKMPDFCGHFRKNRERGGGDILPPALADGTSHRGEEIFRRKDGTDFPVEYTCVPIKADNGKAGVVVTFQDITARKKDEAEKKVLQDQLLQSQKVEAIGQLAGGVAHDFNNLLMAINGYGQLIMQQIPPADPLRQDVKEILKAGDRAAALTRQLLAFGRRQPLQPRVLALNTIIGDMEKMLRRLIGEDIRFRTEFAVDLHQVSADPGQIEQVVMNLAVNARDAMPQGGELTIKSGNVAIDEEFCRLHPAARPGEFICLSVEDTGTGMSREVARRIFEPFFSTKGLKGTGLGLAVAYGIIKQHDGWITVYSEPDQGSTFRIYLPALTRPEPDKERQALANLQTWHGKGERILVAEDENKVRQLVSRVLGANGYQVEAAGSVAEALDLFAQKEEHFDMLFTDVVLPDQSGLHLIDELLLRKPEVKVLVTSGYTDHKSQWPLIQQKGFRFLEKPYALTTLLKVVREVLDG